MVSQRRFPEFAIRFHDTLRWSRHLAGYVFSAAMKRPGILLLAKAARPFLSPAAIGSTARSGVLAGATSALLCARAARRAVDRIAMRRRADNPGTPRSGRILFLGAKALQGVDQGMQMGAKDDGSKPGKVPGTWGDKSRNYGNLVLSMNLVQ
eukprot:TRINITY_DN985_c0_g1_i1.p1 TRINITY_DN985_c0_g1~~TRINITY_DN985_c0_g1_i1.p1  ORF type:complete len:172 (-),score=29.75 TRINITY_DN985_c0_g1_i1:540-995(-)